MLLNTFAVLLCTASSLPQVAGQCPFTGALSNDGLECPMSMAQTNTHAARILLWSKSTYAGAEASGFYEIQSFDGRNNNLVNPSWGSAGELLRRSEPSNYVDGFSRPAGGSRPNPRNISTVLMNAVGSGVNDDAATPLNGITLQRNKRSDSQAFTSVLCHVSVQVTCALFVQICTLSSDSSWLTRLHIPDLRPAR